MKQYHVISGVEASKDLPTVTISNEGKAFGSVQGWSLLIDAEHRPAGALLNRVTGKALPIIRGVFNTVQVNGKTLTRITQSPVEILADFDLNPESYTIFGVVKVAAADTAPFTLLTSVNAVSATDDVAPHFAIAENGTRLFASRRGGTTTYASGNHRVEYTSNYLTSLKLVMLTFSTIAGLTIYENGAKVASKTDDKRAINKNYRANEMNILRSFVGDFGAIGVLNTDLSLNDKDRASITDFYMQKYGL